MRVLFVGDVVGRPGRTAVARLLPELRRDLAVDIAVVNGRVRGVETTRGAVASPRVLIAVACHSSVLAAKAGLKLPIQSMALQAMVTEPVKPLINTAPRHRPNTMSNRLMPASIDASPMSVVPNKKKAPRSERDADCSAPNR